MKKRHISLIVISSIIILSSVGVGVWGIIDKNNTQCLGIVDVVYLPSIQVNEEWNVNFTTGFVPDSSWVLKESDIRVLEEELTVLISVCARNTNQVGLAVLAQFDVTIYHTFQIIGLWTVRIANQTLEVDVF